MRLRGLDILRGIAVLLVLLRHHPGPPSFVSPRVRAIGEMSQQVGWIGVDLFFVLSGFLVAGLLFREHRRHGGLALGRFWARRGFKIYPAFYVMLAATWWMQQHGDSPVPPNATERLVYEAIYLQNYFRGLWNHTWSLAVEEHFYVLLPLVLVGLAAGSGTDRFARVWPLLLAACVAILALRVWIVRAPQPFEAYLFPTHLRIDSLLWGVLLSYAFHQRDRAWLARLRRWTPLVVLVAAVLLAPPFFLMIGDSVFLGTWGLTTIALGFTLLVALTLAWASDDATWRPRLPLIGALVAAIGVDSYSIYLWHLGVQRWIMPWCHRSVLPPMADPTRAYLLDLGTYVLTAVVVGLVAARVVERPMLALRDWLVPSRSGQAVVTAAAPAGALEIATVASGGS